MHLLGAGASVVHVILGWLWVTEFSQLWAREVLGKGCVILLVAVGMKIVGPGFKAFWMTKYLQDSGHHVIQDRISLVPQGQKLFSWSVPSDKWNFSCHHINSHWAKELLEMIFKSVEHISYKSYLVLHQFIHTYQLSMCSGTMIYRILMMVEVRACLPFPL